MFLSAYNYTPVRKTRRVSIIYWSTLVQKFPSHEPFTSYGGRRKVHEKFTFCGVQF